MSLFHSTAAPQPLSQEELLQLHTTLTEAFSSVVYFLHSLEQLDPDSVLLREGVVFAAVRYGEGGGGGRREAEKGKGREAERERGREGRGGRGRRCERMRG